MKNLLVLYASVTGNTEIVALFMQQHIKGNYPDYHLVTKSMQELTPAALASFDKVVIGSSTWDEGLLNMFALEFFDKLEEEKVELKGLDACVFALGESFYPEFATAADIMNEKLSARGAIVNDNMLRIDGYPDEPNLSLIEGWLKEILSA